MTNLGRAKGAPLGAIQARLALLRLLRLRAVEEPYSKLMDGLRRRERVAGFRGGMAARAMELRGLPPPSSAELAAAEAEAAAAMPAFIRLGLLSVLLGELAELSVNLD